MNILTDFKNGSLQHQNNSGLQSHKKIFETQVKHIPCPIIRIPSILAVYISHSGTNVDL